MFFEKVRRVQREAFEQPDNAKEEAKEQTVETPKIQIATPKTPTEEPETGSTSKTDPNSPNFDPFNKPGYIYVPGFGYVERTGGYNGEGSQEWNIEPSGNIIAN